MPSFKGRITKYACALYFVFLEDLRECTVKIRLYTDALQSEERAISCLSSNAIQNGLNNV